MRPMDILGLVAADGPYPEHAEELMAYGQFVGSWDVEATWHDRDGGERRAKGEWHFAWVLGGLGIQDVLFAIGAAPHDYGTSLRCYDPAAGVWHVVWMQPHGSEFVYMTGRNTGERIEQEVMSVDSGRRERWVFTDVTPNTFRWLDEVSLDNGVTWFLQHEMQCTRQTG
ncbi:MAG: hypothetical protein JXA57_01645 [Armatimonadetes bacterium]|nr:hypothetical protein [Armatimonadota bacterium]